MTLTRGTLFAFGVTVVAVALLLGALLYVGQATGMYQIPEVSER